MRHNTTLKHLEAVHLRTEKPSPALQETPIFAQLVKEFDWNKEVCEDGTK